MGSELRTGVVIENHSARCHRPRRVERHVTFVKPSSEGRWDSDKAPSTGAAFVVEVG
jgi:hypothetical protein